MDEKTVTRVPTQDKRRQNHRRVWRKKLLTDSTWNIRSGAFPHYNFVKKTDNKVYTFTQEVAPVTMFTTSTSTPSYSANAFMISSIDQVTSLGNVFDQYRIDEIEIWLYPGSNASSTEQNLEGANIASVIDYDDATALTSYAQACDYTNCISTTLANGHYRRFRPHAAAALYSGSFTSYGNVESPWIDMSSTSVQHYGLKVACTLTPVTAIAVQILCRFHLSFRNVR
jgi:hypothetical protein